MHALSTTHPMSKITRSAISRKPVNQKIKKKGRENIFLHLYTGFGVKIQNTHRYRNSATFWTSHQSALNCRLIQVSLGVYRVFQTFFGPAEFPGYHQCQQESQ